MVLGLIQVLKFNPRFVMLRLVTRMLSYLIVREWYSKKIFFKKSNLKKFLNSLYFHCEFVLIFETYL